MSDYNSKANVVCNSRNETTELSTSAGWDTSPSEEIPGPLPSGLLLITTTLHIIQIFGRAVGIAYVLTRQLLFRQQGNLTAMPMLEDLIILDFDLDSEMKPQLLTRDPVSGLTNRTKLSIGDRLDMEITCGMHTLYANIIA